jgi:hypothetical protein
MKETYIQLDNQVQGQIQDQVQEEQVPTKKTFFQKIAFILLDNKRKTEVAEEIIEDGNMGKIYWLQIILSGIICTL